jgi:hypothetical protein
MIPHTWNIIPETVIFSYVIQRSTSWSGAILMPWVGVLSVLHKCVMSKISVCLSVCMYDWLAGWLAGWLAACLPD